MYSQLGGPGRRYLKPIGLWVFLTYDLVHIFKNLRNNWITEATQRLSFMKDGIEYIACWNDIKKLYNKDKQTSLRLTKLTHTVVYTKPLQRQSIPLVHQVFNEKTITALSTLQAKLNISSGTIAALSTLQAKLNISSGTIAALSTLQAKLNISSGTIAALSTLQAKH